MKLEHGDFIVDGWKHRIAKREGKWLLYCPGRGVDDLIVCDRIEWALFALTSFPCAHGQTGRRESHGVFLREDRRGQ